jgi:glycosyltransferase involved in cell wall biosynthesis
MKVCMVSKHFHPFSGGLEVRVLELGRWLVLRGEAVQVFTLLEPGTKGIEVVDGIEVRRSRKFASLFNAHFVPGILGNLMSRDYDIIDVNLPDPINSMFAVLASLVRRKPLIVTYHADIIREGVFYLPFMLFYAPLEWLVLSRASRILVTSPDYARTSSTLRGFMGKVQVASSFIDPGRYNTSVDGSAVRKRHGLKGRVVLFVGRLVPYKGVEYLIDAATQVPDATFLIVGDGPLRDSLKRKASGSANVVFAGQVGDDELPGYYGACDVFVLPSVTRQEAFGLVLVEAMACGKPVVSTSFSGMPYVVGDGGLLVAPRDAKALADAIKRVLSDGRVAKELSGKGVKRVAELFLKDVVCARILDVYKSALSRI